MTICKGCRDAADGAINGAGEPCEHPENCGCPCAHMPRGSWKGNKDDEDS
jgi:hypothetical protein